MLLLTGILGMALAGAVVLIPFESASEEDGADDTGSDPQRGGVADLPPPDLSLLDEAPDEPAGGPDLRDEVHGQHMGDALGGNLFETLMSETDASTGGVGDDRLDGGRGADLIIGNEGNDSITGGDGKDLLIGEDGDDFIEGGDGTDVLRGGDGADVLRGDDGSDLLTGGEGDDLLAGGDGDDHLFGQLGSDTLLGGDGADFLDGTHAATTAPAWTDADDADTLIGGDGDDVLVLGAGDLATGGLGDDSFALGAYEGSQVVPVITDFDPDEDELQLLYERLGETDPSVSTVESDGKLTVRLDGVSVVHLEGLTHLDPNLIRLVPVTG